MLQRAATAHLASDEEHLLKVQLLGRADDVEDALGLIVADALLDRRQIGGAVEKRAVGLADQQRRGRSIDVADHGATALLGDPVCQ